MGIEHKINRALRSAVRKVIGKGGATPVWPPLLGADSGLWEDAKQSAQTGPRVLMATGIGGYPLGSFVESALALALTLRGAQVDVLLCDRFLPACQLTELSNTEPGRLLKSPPQPRCDSCFA